MKKILYLLVCIVGPAVALAAGADQDSAAARGMRPTSSGAAYREILQIGEDYRSSQKNRSKRAVGAYQELLSYLDTRVSRENGYAYLRRLAADLKAVEDWGIKHNKPVTDKRPSLFHGYRAVKIAFGNMVKIRNEEAARKARPSFEIRLAEPVSLNLNNWVSYLSGGHY